ncbi:MAG TPA: DUF885 domain-containing protein [Terriglobales bacterium]|nr:DUF885 domain-containing protein [Terriglobales bacterium]
MKAALRACAVLTILLVFPFDETAVAQAKETSLGIRRPAAAGTAWNQLVDEFFDRCYFPFHPTEGTAAGLHQYDAQLEDYSREAIEREIASLGQCRKRLQSFAPPEPATVAVEVVVDHTGRTRETKVIRSPSRELTEAAKRTVTEWRFEPSRKDGKPIPVKVLIEVPVDLKADRQMLLDNIDASLLELEIIRMWERDPDRYSGGISNSVFVIISRKFAPPAVRLRSVTARERKMPQVFEAARANLKDVPRIYTEIALVQLPGIVSFFQSDVPTAFKEVKEAKLLAEFKQTNQAVIDALKSYQKWLQEDLLARSKGDFRIGAESYRKKLLYEEMVDTPLDELLKIGYADLRRNQQRFKEVAAKIDPSKTSQQLWEELEKDHPAPGKLLQSFRDVLGGLREFIEKKKIVTIPSPVPPLLEETPPFMRALTFASMDTPGPYETSATEAFFNVTLPEADWPEQRTREHMAGFNAATIISTAIHEAYPGHYTQFLWVQRAPSKVRKLLGSGTNSEGWAHYCEQMMLDEGYGKGPAGQETPEFLKLRLGQLQDALLRNARYIVGMEMHTGKMSYEQGIDFFIKEGYQTRANALRETMRGTADPTYLMYTLGKLQILKLRDDYKKLQGEKFTLQEFHDKFLQQGFPPIKIVRKAMLGEESPVL